MSIRIAIVRSLDEHVTICGPGDFDERDHESEMDAALSWHLEAGHLPAATYWATIELPPLPTIPELRALAEAGAFPKSFVDEMDA